MDNKTLKAKANATALMLIAHSSDTEDWEILLRPVCIGLNHDEIARLIHMAHIYYCFHTRNITEHDCKELMKKIEGE